jgi:nucleolar protein 15
VKAAKGKNGGKISVKNDGKDSNNNEPTNNIYIGHIPEGFEEKEMRDFFKQFGDVRKVKLFRSAKTNRSRGYAFAQFKDKDVAKIVADTMNGYLIMGRQLVCHVIPQGKCHDGMYKRKYNKELMSKPRDVSNHDDED